MHRKTLLERVYRDIKSDPNFEHLRYKSRFVPGDGPLTPVLALVGEAPGEVENERRLPFQGASGQLLDRLLMHIGIHRKEVYVTNLLKYRPNHNRDPHPEEAALASQYLARELRIVHCPIVVTLGRHALFAIRPDASLGQIHGRAVPYIPGDGTRTLFAMYHPAFGLYDPRNVVTLTDDMESLARYMEGRHVNGTPRT